MNYEISSCCSSIRWNDTDICAECREHADFEPDFLETQIITNEIPVKITIKHKDEIESIRIDNKEDTL